MILKLNNTEKLVDLDISSIEEMNNLKAAMLGAQTLGELHALMEDYSYMEFMQIYNQLTLEQQAQLDALDRCQ